MTPGGWFVKKAVEIGLRVGRNISPAAPVHPWPDRHGHKPEPLVPCERINISLSTDLNVEDPLILSCGHAVTRVQGPSIAILLCSGVTIFCGATWLFIVMSAVISSLFFSWIGMLSGVVLSFCNTNRLMHFHICPGESCDLPLKEFVNASAVTLTTIVGYCVARLGLWRQLVENPNPMLHVSSAQWLVQCFQPSFAWLGVVQVVLTSLGYHWFEQTGGFTGEPQGAISLRTPSSK